MESLLASPSTAPLLTRERVSPLFFFSYTFIPLSTIAFPHITIFCLTARRMAQFKRTVIFYPLCILAIWLPCVFLGVAANAMRDVPRIEQKLEARAALAAAPAVDARPTSAPTLRRQAAGDDVVLVMLERYAPLWLAGLLGAGIMAAVMASDSQILALSTMFTEDVFAFYGGKARFGEAVQVQTGRLFVVAADRRRLLIALRAPQSIFDLAVQYAFSGYCGAVAAAVRGAVLEAQHEVGRARGRRCGPRSRSIYTARVPGALAWFGLMPVVPMTLDLVRADGRRVAGDAAAVSGDDGAVSSVCRHVQVPVPAMRRRSERRAASLGDAPTSHRRCSSLALGTCTALRSRPVDLQRARGIEGPRIERAGPLLRGEREVRDGAFACTPLSRSRSPSPPSRQASSSRRASVSAALSSRLGAAESRAAPRSGPSPTVGVPADDVRSRNGEREAVRDVVAGGERVGAGVRGAEHRLLDRRAGEMRAELHRARAPRIVRGCSRTRSKASREQPPGLVREHVRQRRPPGRDRGFDGVRDRVESGHRGDVRGAPCSVSSGSRIATRNAADGSPQAIFMCVAASAITA